MSNPNSKGERVGFFSVQSKDNFRTESLGKTDFNDVEEKPKIYTSQIFLEISSSSISLATDAASDLNEDKNVITKDDVEKVLDLKFVQSPLAKHEVSADPNGINVMKLSYHNFGAFEAYERTRARRILEKAQRKHDLRDVADIDGREYNEQDVDDAFTRKALDNSVYKSMQNLRCHAEDKGCEVLRKTHRLAEVLISNIEEIKFLAGGPCDLCGRESCDGFNHFPQIPPADLLQGDQSDIDAATDSATHLLDESQVEPLLYKLPSEPAYAPYKSNEDFEFAFTRHRGDSNEKGIDRLSIDSSNKEDIFVSVPSYESIQFPSVFTLKFLRIELLPDGLDTLEYSTRATKGFKFNYVFLMYKESVEFPALVQGDNININDSRIHQFSMNPLVYQYLYNCCLHVELYDIPVITKRGSKFIGNCDVCFKKVLFSNNKPNKMKLLITDRDRIAFVSSGKETEFGHLIIEVILEADEDHLANLARTVRVKRSAFDVMGTGSFTEFMDRTESAKSLSRSQVTHMSDARYMLIQTQYDAAPHSSMLSLVLTAYEKGLVSEAEQKAFYDALQLVLVRNKALRTRQSEIDMELNDRAEWMHEELKWRLTLQEHAILSGKDPESVRWRQWRDENTSDVRFRTIMDEEIEYEPVIVITVQSLELLPISQVMFDESIKLIYVEYAFLTHSGLELETKSLPKNAEGLIVYDFVRRFDISINRDNLDTQVLAEHIRSNQSIKFTVVHEPIEDPEELQSCMALGSCEINLFHLAQNVSNTHEDVYHLKNAKTGAQDVGHLKLRFDGVRAMRTVALTLLAPSAFKIYR